MPDAHYRVVIRTEKVDKDGNVEDVVSEDVLADFEDDQTDESEGQKSYNYHNAVRRLSENA